MYHINELEVETLCNNMVKLCAADGIPRHVEVKRGHETIRLYNARCRDGVWKAELDYVMPPYGLIIRGNYDLFW